MAGNDIDMAVEPASIKGWSNNLFHPVVEEFAKNFRERDELGASLCIYHEGRLALDLHGGHVDSARQQPWTTDTLVPVMSSTKGLAALCAHLLIDRGQLDPEAPVSEYWPEFVANGKELARVSMILNHSLGLPVLKTPVKQGGFLDFDYICELLANEKPFWKPGTSVGYHGLTYGHLLGEVFRRITGTTIGQFLRREIAEPLSADVWIGLPESERSRVSRIEFIEPSEKGNWAETESTRLIHSDPESIPALFVLNSGGYATGDAVNSAEAQAVEIPAGNALANGRGLATVYAPFATSGQFRDKQWVGQDTLYRMEEVSSATSLDQTLYIGTRWSLGFQKSVDNRWSGIPESSMVLGSRAFGHGGAGGSLGFADPECGISFGYAMNRMAPTPGVPEKCQALVDATYRALGYRSCGSGSWRR
ncbi:serine hydrolase domain-containing protein [Pseudohaliea sp.]|uniref:serine hydrolase domain-containing protein n=1 Tax=Pseudohaliea sp. TaxID=2740289 RepID=UPI0032EFA554